MGNGPHTDQTRIHNSQFVCFRVDRDWIETIADDNVIQYGLTVRRPDGDLKFGEPAFPFKLEQEPQLINGFDFEGGLLILSSLKPHVLQRAIATGLSYLMQSGQISCDDFWDNNGHES